MEERGWTPTSRAVLSAVAIAFGWGAAFLVYTALMNLGSPVPRMSGGDAASILFHTARYVALGWLFFVLPVAIFANPHWRILYWPLCPLFGAAYGLLAFMVLIGWLRLWRYPIFMVHATVVGAVAGLVYGIGVLIPRGGARYES